MALGSGGYFIVVGAGIGGLAAALALARGGRNVRVLERAEQLVEAATGGVLWPNGVRALELLGVGRGRLREARELRRTLTFSFRGGRPWRRGGNLDLGKRAAAPALLISLADLHRTLREELASSAHADVVCMHQSFAGFSQDQRGVTVTLGDGGREQGLALIGADGVHSRVRRALLGDRALLFRDRTWFRGVANAPALLPRDADFLEYHGADARFAHFGIGAGRSAWQACVSGRVPVTTNAALFLRERFRAFPRRLQELVAATPAADIQRTAICDLAVLERWVSGRVALLGNAAHPMTPDLGQGINQALEDAVVLGSEIAHSHDVALALERYQSRRLGRAARAVRASRLAGQFASLPGALGLRVRELGLRLMPAALAARGFGSVPSVESEDGFALVPLGPVAGL